MNKVEALVEATGKADIIYVDGTLIDADVVHAKAILSGNGNAEAIRFISRCEAGDYGFSFTNDELANATVDGNKIIVDQDGDEFIIELFNRVPALIEL